MKKYSCQLIDVLDNKFNTMLRCHLNHLIYAYAWEKYEVIYHIMNTNLDASRSLECLSYITNCHK